MEESIMSKDDEFEESESKDEEIHLKDTGEIELPTIDVSKYVGKKVEIELVTEHKGQYGYYVKVQSEIVDTIEGGKKPIELRASRIFGLQEDEHGKIGWGKKTKLGLFLKKMKVAHYNELKGEEVVAQSMTNKNGVDFLTFN